jgi:endonuclease III
MVGAVVVVADYIVIVIDCHIDRVEKREHIVSESRSLRSVHPLLAESEDHVLII